MIVSWSLGVVSRFVCGSSDDSKVGDCGDSHPCMFGEMGGSPSAPCRCRVGVPVGVAGDSGDSVASSVLTSMCVFVGSSDVSIGVEFW